MGVNRSRPQPSNFAAAIVPRERARHLAKTYMINSDGTRAVIPICSTDTYARLKVEGYQIFHRVPAKPLPSRNQTRAIKPAQYALMHNQAAAVSLSMISSMMLPAPKRYVSTQPDNRQLILIESTEVCNVIRPETVEDLFARPGGSRRGRL